jgi:hypothetical protein
MAIKKSRSRWWSRLHFLVRFLGLTGILCVGVGVGLAYYLAALAWETFGSPQYVYSTLTGANGDWQTVLAVGLILGGGLAAVLAVFVEIVAILVVAAGRRSAVGANAIVQIVLAAALLIGVNIYSFSHYVRLDCTWDQHFTLPEDIQNQLRQLDKDKPTTIVVYQRHKTFGALKDTPDNKKDLRYDLAAERKVVDKVRDLVEQFQEFGPQFRVEVLDVEDDSFNDRLTALTKDAPQLREAIDSAPENSIFFYAGGKVQRLSFNNLYHLDKTASREADNGRGNLVLLNQGPGPFARKVLNVNEKRPRVGLLVIHDVLTTKGPEAWGLAGVRKSLEAHGFDVRDVVLKKWTGAPEPAVYTYDESRLDQLEDELAELEPEIKDAEKEVAKWTKARQSWESKSLEELTKEYADQLQGRKITANMRREQLAAIQQNEMILKAILSQQREEREALLKEKKGLNVTSLAEQRRITDLKSKLERSIADCDLLIVPRMTIRNAINDQMIPNQIQHLDQAQADALRDYLKKGKPILACFGPINLPPNERMQIEQQLGPEMPDGLERDLNDLGIRLGKQTVLFNAETKAYAERRSGPFAAGNIVEVPGIEFEGGGLTTRALLKLDRPAPAPNPVGTSMAIVAHSLGRKDLDLRLRFPRPVYYDPAKPNASTFEPEFMMTSGASWNEEQPFPTRERSVPRFEPPKADDPTADPLEKKRRGPFPVGVAVDAPLPEKWYSGQESHPATVRVATIGSGTVFVGDELSPAKEELLLNTCNWLLGRDDLLPTANQTWEYPRVDLTEREQNLWNAAAFIGLPGLFIYLGLVVWMVRNLR